MSTVVDMSDVVDMTPLPVGDYIVTLTGVKVKPSSDPSKASNASFEYTVHEDDPNLTDEGESYAGRKLWQNHNLAKNSLWKLKQTLMAFDADPDEIKGSFSLEEVVGELIGNKARARVVPNTNAQYGPTTAGVSPISE